MKIEVSFAKLQPAAGNTYASWDDSGLDMYEFKWRMDDPQTGRFWQLDPLSDKYVYNSTYAFSENKVTGHVELEGLEAVDAENKKKIPETVSTSVPSQNFNDKGYLEQSAKSSTSNGNLPSVLTFTSVITKGETGTVSLGASILGIDFSYSNSVMEQDIFGIRDNNFVEDGKDFKNNETVTTFGGGFDVAGFGAEESNQYTKSGNSLEVSETHSNAVSVPFVKKTTSQTSSSINGKSTGSKTRTDYSSTKTGVKVGAGYGLEVKLDINWSSLSVSGAIAPSTQYNTSESTKIPKIIVW